MTITGSIPDTLTEYWTDVYGEATIPWVPPVAEYNYPENLGLRTVEDGDFRWEEVTISLSGVMDGALIDFTVPDSYIVQITPDIGWGNVLGMFGEDEELDLKNPHINAFGPFMISAGTLTDNADGTVTAGLSQAQMTAATIPGFTKYLWRAVPWANNNPGLGGLPEKFDYLSSVNQLNFTVDEIIKETRRAVQTISGTKSPRTNISIEDQNNPTVFVEQTEASWRVFFTIDRSLVQFRIKASDDSGTLVGFHRVSIEYDSFNQEEGHIWNSFDGFGLFASVERLPEENSASLRKRTIDAFANRGGSDYTRLIAGVNRELNIGRVPEGITIKRALNAVGKPTEVIIDIDSTHTRLSVRVPSFIRNDETKRINSYLNKITTDKRIHKIVSIVTERGVEISSSFFEVNDEPEGNEIEFDPSLSGVFRITYEYIEDINYADNPLLGDVSKALNNMMNPSGIHILSADIDPSLSGSEDSLHIYKQSGSINIDFPMFTLGWSRVGLFSISNREWKRSFRDQASMYFNSSFYRYVLELKSQTNIEWGFVVVDKDFWDPLDSPFYGRQALEVPFDIKLSQYSAPIRLPTADGVSDFDAWEAFRMGYYFDKTLLKNYGFPKVAFRSGVGFEKDCFVGLETTTIRAPEDKINLNPVVQLPKGTIDIDQDKISDIIITF